MFAALKRRLTDGLDGVLGRYTADKELLEGAMAACAMIAAADGHVSPTEKSKIGGFIRRHETMRHFDASQAVDLFNKYADGFEFDPGLGADACLKEMRQVKGEEKRRLLVLVALAVGTADGDLAEAEKKAVGRIVDELGLSRADFGL